MFGGGAVLGAWVCLAGVVAWALDAVLDDVFYGVAIGGLPLVVQADSASVRMRPLRQ